MKRLREAGALRGQRYVYWEKNMGECSDGRMVSILSTDPDPSMHLRKCELPPDVCGSISRTHMTDALSRFSACSLQ